MEWIDTNQPVTYIEQEKKWHQRISWKDGRRILHADVLYDYEQQDIHVSTPFEENGYFEAIVEETNPCVLQSLLEDASFSRFLEERKQIYTALQPLLRTENWPIETFRLKKDDAFLKEVYIPLTDSLQLTAIFEKQIAWSLSELSLLADEQILRHVFQGTMVEKRIEAALYAHIFY